MIAPRVARLSVARLVHSATNARIAARLDWRKQVREACSGPMPMLRGILACPFDRGNRLTRAVVNRVFCASRTLVEFFRGADCALFGRCWGLRNTLPVPRRARVGHRPCTNVERRVYIRVVSQRLVRCSCKRTRCLGYSI